MTPVLTGNQARTPSELLIKVLEFFGESEQEEPEQVMVLWTTKGGDICWSSTTDSNSAKIGMLEIAKYQLLQK